MEIVKHYLNLFASEADAWFKLEEPRLIENLAFFQKFKQREFLEKARWEDFQELGVHVNSFNTNALAKARALGQPNHPIEHYREQFIQLFYGDAPVEIRFDTFIREVKFFKESTTSEILGNAFPIQYVFFNGVDKEAIELLEIEIAFERGDSYGVRFVKYNQVLKPLISLYSEIVGQKTKTTIPIEFDQFLRYVVNTLEESEGEIDDDTLTNVDSDNPTFWLLAPGDNAYKWDEFYNNGYAGIGWDDLGDLKAYTSKDQIKIRLKELYGGKTSKSNDALACYEFGNKVRKGDIIITKKGVNAYIGWGIVISDYYFETDASEFKHRRNVKWMAKGVWEEANIVQKTLTNISKYPDYIERLKTLLKIDPSAGFNKKIKYWWLNANPKYWNILDFKKGEQQTYTSKNEKGNKRRIYEYFTEVRPGDLMIGYQTSPEKRIVALFEISKALHEKSPDGEIIEFTIIDFFKEPVSWEELLNVPELKECEVLKNNQGSLFKLTAFEFEAIRNLIDEKNAPLIEKEPKGYSRDQAIQESSLTPELFNRYFELIKRKKQVIFQGPPGTGKSYLAEIFATFLANGNTDQFEVIQFHPSYSYEDFVQGYRPSPNIGHFDLKDGVFKEICRKASVSQSLGDQKNYVILIDEINRGNLSKIFGELLYLLEYRNKNIKLTYSPELDFKIPENLFILGTMNTADRSLALVDYALRRRFSFIRLFPDYEILRNRLRDKCDGINLDLLLRNYRDVNVFIEKTPSLGSEFSLGHSFLLKDKNIDATILETIWEFELKPLLEEYYFDNTAQVEQIKQIYSKDL